MKTFLIEAQILEQLDGGARVRLLTDFGNPSVVVSHERLIKCDVQPDAK